jgi:hypothetical protein
MEKDQEREDLEALLTAPGWLRLVNHATQYWTEDIATKVEQAADDVNDLQALHRLRQLVVARREVMKLLAYPSERVKALRQQDTVYPPSLSRRGSL